MQNRTKGAETKSSKPAMHRGEMALKRNFQKLRESPSVRYESVGRGFEALPSHQEKPVHIVYWFFFFVCAMEGARTGRRRIAPQAISPVGCCLARGFQRVGMSTAEAVDRKISWLFCFSGRVCTLYKKAMNSLHRLHSVYFAAQKLSLSGHCPDKLGGVFDRENHGLQSTSRWFCKFYCSKAVIVGLIS